MAFISLLVLCPLMLGMLFLILLLPALGWALNVAAWFLLAVNLALLILLLVLRAKWKGTGRQDPAYIDSFTGWRRMGLLLVKYLLLLAPIWEGTAAALCALYLIVQPIQRFLLA